MSALGNGIYGYSEAGRLIGSHRSTVYSWFRNQPGHRAVLKSDYRLSLSFTGPISFLDLIEAKVVSNLRDLGVSMSNIRRAYGVVSRELGKPHPFSVKDIYTDGHTILFEAVRQISRGKLIDALHKQQFFPSFLSFLQRVDYDRGSLLATRWRIADGVVIDPLRRYGKPIVDRCGFSTSILSAAYQANGRDADRVAEWYGVLPSDVSLAVEFEKTLTRKAA